MALSISLFAIFSISATPAQSQSQSQSQTQGQVRVVNPCPWNFGQTAPDLAESTALEPTLAAVQQYIYGPGTPPSATVPAGQVPPDQFGNVGMGSVANLRVVILEVVGGEEAQLFHAQQLQSRVPRPDRMVVCGIAISAGRYRSISTELYTGPTGRDPSFYGVERMPDGHALIRLAGGAEQLANEVTSKYGTDVVIARGRLLWPAETPVAGGEPCPKVKPGSGPKLRWKLPKSIRVRSGIPIPLTGSVANRTSTQIQTPGFVAVITRKGTADVVANRAVGYAWTLELSYLRPGETMPVSSVISTDSCPGTPGYSLAPGRYDLYLVDQRTQSGAISAAIPLTVTR